MNATRLLIVLVIVIAVLLLIGNRPVVNNGPSNVRSTARDVGQELKATGRDVAETIRRTVE
jgi:hypothetical protein